MASTRFRSIYVVTPLAMTIRSVKGGKHRIVKNNIGTYAILNTIEKAKT